jgi:hypothetical protein
MSKEKTEAWRSMRANEMAETAPRVVGAQEDALHTLWSSERRTLIDGKWYVPISEVVEVLHTTTVEPLSEEWQAKTFPNLRIGEDGPTVRAHYWKDRNRKETTGWFSEEDRKQRGR